MNMPKTIEGNPEKEMSLDSAVITYFEAMEVLILMGKGTKVAEELGKPDPAENIVQEKTIVAEKAYDVIFKHTVMQLLKPDEERDLGDFLQEEFNTNNPYIASFIRRGGDLSNFLYKLAIDVGSIFIESSRAASESLGGDLATEVLQTKMAGLVDEVIAAKKTDPLS